MISQLPFLFRLSHTPNESDDRAEISWTIFRSKMKPDRDSCRVAHSGKKKPSEYELRTAGYVAGSELAAQGP